jgi:hypothetical protein
MPTYANLGGRSSVVAYDFDPAGDWIDVTFKSGRWRHYLYTSASAGAGNVQRMIQLAQAGQGLGSFIQKRVKHAYARRS